MNTLFRDIHTEIKLPKAGKAMANLKFRLVVPSEKEGKRWKQKEAHGNLNDTRNVPVTIWGVHLSAYFIYMAYMPPIFLCESNIKL